MLYEAIIPYLVELPEINYQLIRCWEHIYIEGYVESWTLDAPVTVSIAEQRGMVREGGTKRLWYTSNFALRITERIPVMSNDAVYILRVVPQFLTQLGYSFLNNLFKKSS